MNLPNKLTLLRVCMIPFFVVLARMSPFWAQCAAVGVYALACVTDALDGRIRLPGNVPPIPEEKIPEAFILRALASEMETCIIPWQDLLSLGTEARINVPGIVNEENWRSRMTGFAPLSSALAEYGEAAKQAGR